jgi:hypothetical protein
LHSALFVLPSPEKPTGQVLAVDGLMHEKPGAHHAQDVLPGRDVKPAGHGEEVDVSLTQFAVEQKLPAEHLHIDLDCIPKSPAKPVGQALQLPPDMK